MHGDAVEVDQFAQHIARGAGYLGDDGAVLAGQGVEQAGFSGVGPADDGQHETVAKQPALARAAEQVAELLGSRLGALDHVALGQEVDFLVGKIDGGFDEDPQVGKDVLQLVNAR